MPGPRASEDDDGPALPGLFFATPGQLDGVARGHAATATSLRRGSVDGEGILMQKASGAVNAIAMRTCIDQGRHVERVQAIASNLIVNVNCYR